MPKLLNIVATECSLQEEVRFNNWYNDVHVPMLMKYSGISRVTRYRLQGEAQGAPTYLACYEFDTNEALTGMQESDEFKAAIQEMQETWSDGGFSISWSAVYEPIRAWER